MFQKAVEQKVNYDAGYFQLSLSQEALGEIDGAIISGGKALEINPKNENYILALARMYQTRAKGDDNKTAEQLYQYAVSQNDGNLNGHFYFGLFYEKNKNKQGAKDEYKKVISLLGDNSAEAKKQIERMISNVDAGIENTPENLGLIQDKNEAQNSEGQ
jgi:cytochrome c-type biogenesis protein CcmH/NrfG